MRLIFVADKIPAELRRIVELLNKQMNPAEVLAVEIQQHVAEGQEEKAFVPRLIRRTADAERIKLDGTRSSIQWDRTSFFEELEAKVPEAGKPARAILEWAESRKQGCMGERTEAWDFQSNARSSGISAQPIRGLDRRIFVHSTRRSASLYSSWRRIETLGASASLRRGSWHLYF